MKPACVSPTVSGFVVPPPDLPVYDLSGHLREIRDERYRFNGLGQLVARARRSPLGEAAAGWAIALVLSGTLISASMFLPVAVANVRRMAEAQLVLPRMLREVPEGRVLVFQQFAVPPWLGLSWAYYPRANSPRLDDDILYVRPLGGTPERIDRNLEFWRRRYPDRPAWFFAYQGRDPQLVPLETYLESVVCSEMKATSLWEKGEWTDDTSMALCLGERLDRRGEFDAVDQLDRYCRWYRKGHLSSTGSCFVRRRANSK